MARGQSNGTDTAVESRDRRIDTAIARIYARTGPRARTGPHARTGPRARKTGTLPDLDDFGKLCHYRHENTGIEAVVTNAERVRDHEMLVEGDIQSGHSVIGSFQRWAWLDGAERRYLVVKPSWLQLDEDYRGRGFGSAFHQVFEDRCRQAGVDRVEILAQEIGAYSWARCGYQLRADDYSPALLEDNYLRGDGDEYADTRLGDIYKIQAAKTITRLVGRREQRLEQLIGQGKVSPSSVDRLRSQLIDDDIPSGYFQADDQLAEAKNLAQDKIHDLASLADFGHEQGWIAENGKRTWLGREILLDNEWRGFKFLQPLPN